MSHLSLLLNPPSFMPPGGCKYPLYGRRVLYYSFPSMYDSSVICSSPFTYSGQSCPTCGHIVQYWLIIKLRAKSRWNPEWQKSGERGTIGIARGRSSTRNPATWLWMWLWLCMSLVLVSHSAFLWAPPSVCTYKPSCRPIVAFPLVRFLAIVLPPPPYISLRL